MGHLGRLHGRMGAARPSRLVRHFPAGLDRRRLAARLGRCRHHDLVAESGGDARLGLARAVPARRTLALRRRLSAPERRRDADLRSQPPGCRRSACCRRASARGARLRLHHLLDHRLLHAARLDAELHPALCRAHALPGAVVEHDRPDRHGDRGSGLALVLPLQILFGILLALYSGPGPAAISEIFPTHLRSTWMSSGYALAVAIFGGFAPFIATWLIQVTGSPVSPTYLYLLPSAVISLAVIWSLKETAGTKLS